MKKLTKLLLSVSSISGMTSFAVSCGMGGLPGVNGNSSNPNGNGNGNKPGTGGTTDPNGGNGSNPQGDFKILYEEFKKEVDKIISQHLNKNISNLYELDEGNGKLNNQFLRLNTLKEKKKPFGEPLDLTEADQIALTADAKKLLVFDELNNLIKKAFDEEKYKILKPDEDTNNSLEITFKSCLILFAESEAITAANVMFDYKINVSYKDFSNNVSVEGFENRFIYGITNSELVNKTVTNIFNNLRTEGVLLDEKHKDLLKITHEKLNIGDERNIWISEEKYSSLLKKYINGDNFKKSFIEDLNKNYELASKNVKFKIKEESGSALEVFDSYSNLSVIKGAEENINWKSSDKISNDYSVTNNQFYDFLFRENKLTQSDTASLNGDKTAAINTNIYEYSKNKFKDMFTNNNKVVANLFKISESQVADKENLKNNVRVGEVSLKNLQLQIGSSFLQQLPNLKLLTSFSAEDKKIEYNLASTKFDQGFFDKSALFASVYKNIASGIKAMKDIYGFNEDNINENFKGDGSFITGKKEYYWKGLSMSNFSGITNNSGLNKNVWDSFNFKDNDLNVQNTLNKNLSLKNSNQSEFLNYILNSGDQEIYNWNFDWNNIILQYKDDKTGAIIKEFKNNIKKLYGTLELNFLNIKFEIDEKVTEQKLRVMSNWSYKEISFLGK
ncbi:hypothetical protein SLITO_v1c08270 [Spiroplasma litorale]|uniref:Lipoprotein n=1 Tax=Spiroplasma litorale TaxID=216942 RepID=A0A0K1W2X6_9MOLU|nr:hypothetical protein [Spiroplasma litorale]AKX34442.1 hypothetical protein SLITO_v1c08270 [Spiroplasma litorale]